MRHAVWTLPIALAALSVIGLASALLGDGAWDVASWLLLVVPVVVMTMRIAQSARERRWRGRVS